MSQYQKRTRFATSRYLWVHTTFLGAPWQNIWGLNRAPQNGTHPLVALLLALFLLLVCHATGHATASNRVTRQTAYPTIAPPLQLRPIESTPVELHTHIVEINVLDGDGGVLRLQTAALYRLHNPGDASATIFVRLATAQATADGFIPQTEISMQLDEQPLVLESADQESYSAQIEIPPDADRTILIQYVQEVADVPLLTVIYPIEELGVWQGNPSLRVTVSLPETVTPTSLVHIQPEGWSYAMTGNVRQPDVQWLYDATLPAQPFLVQMIPPRYWQEIQSAREVAADGDLNAALRLGALYADLYTAATSLLTHPLWTGNPSTRNAGAQLAQQFYAQAVAAFSAGVERASSADAPERGMLHTELARLYRSQILDASGSINPDYAHLLTQEAEAALAAFNAQPAQRRELVQWLHEGLHTLYAAARDGNDWTEAANLLERMETATERYGGGILSPEQLAEERRVITMQQALELLEQDNRTAAMTLAGDALNEAELAPPPESQSLFAAWQITATLTAAEIHVDVLARPVEEQWAAATAAAQQATQAWQAAGFDAELTEQAPLGLGMALTLPEGARAQAAADVLPLGPEWALLRHLLNQLQPTVTATPALFQQQTVISQPLDLRSVGDQWGAVAASLERQVAQFRATAADSAADSEETLRAQLQAISYQGAADTWHDLVQDSWVLVELTTEVGVAGDQPTKRAWMSTVTAPPQQLQLQAQQFNAVRLLLASLLVVLGLFFISGLLWWLL